MSAPPTLSLLSPYLDVHFLFPIISFISNLNVYDPADMKRAKFELLESTNMVDFALQESPGDEKLLQRRQQVVETLLALKQVVLPLATIIDTEMATLKASNDWNRDFLMTQKGIQQPILDSLFQYGKCTYE